MVLNQIETHRSTGNINAFYPAEYNLQPDSMDCNFIIKLKAFDKDVFLCALEATEELMSIFPTLQAKDIIRKPIEKVHFL